MAQAQPWEADEVVTPWGADPIVAPATTTATSLGRNAAAGVLEGAGMAIDTAYNPSGMLGKMLGTGVVFGHDALAPVFGYPRFPEGVRNMLLEDPPTLAASPGARIADMAGASDVPANTLAERAVRGVAAGAEGLAGMGVLPAIAGGVGGLTGSLAAEAVPDWAQPATGMAANLLGAGLFGRYAPRVAGPVLNALGPNGSVAGALDRFTGGPEARGDVPTMRVTPEAVTPEAVTPEAVTPEAAVAPEAAGAPEATTPLGADGIAYNEEQAQQLGRPAAQQTPEGPRPQAAGAQASSAVPEMTLDEFKAHRMQGELNEVMAPPNAGEDNMVYIGERNGVPASVPTLAERMGNPEISQQERLLRERDPNSFDPHTSRANTARVSLYEEDMGSAPARRAVDRDIEAFAQREQPRVLTGAGDLDLRMSAEIVHDMLTDPRLAEREAVRKVMQPLYDALFDGDGALKTDVRAGWGMIDNLRDKIQRSGLQTSQERFVVSHLLDLKNELTRAMNQATSGRFGAYQQQLQGMFQRANAMDVLQDFRTRLTNAKGDVNFRAFHRWLLGVVRERGAPGANPEMALPDSTMRKLIAIDKDLKRAMNIDLGKSRGSPTNLMFALSKSMGLGLVHTAVHGGVAAAGGAGIGNLVAQQAISGLEARLGGIALGRHVRRHLAEPPAGPNYLSDEP